MALELFVILLQFAVIVWLWLRQDKMARAGQAYALARYTNDAISHVELWTTPSGAKVHMKDNCFRIPKQLQPNTSAVGDKKRVFACSFCHVPFVQHPVERKSCITRLGGCRREGPRYVQMWCAYRACLGAGSLKTWTFCPDCCWCLLPPIEQRGD
jgi:hypothetical protein